MSATNELGVTFAESHPADAARVIERATPEATAAFLESTSMDTAAGVLRFMNVSISAAALSRVQIEHAAGIVERMPVPDAALVLRHMERATGESVLARVEDRTAKSLKRLFRYREGAAGWLADPQVLTLPHDISVGDAQKHLRRMAGEALYNVYVTDRDQRLVGVVTIRTLLLARPKQMLESIMQRQPIRVRADLDLATVAVNPAWQDFDMLPVVDKADVFLGVIRHKTIRQLEYGREVGLDIVDFVDVALSIADMYWKSLSGLAAGLSVAATAPRGVTHYTSRR